MKNKTVSMILTLLILLIVFTYFGARYYLNTNYNLLDKLDQTQQFVSHENWEAARQSSQEVHNIWKKHRFLIMVNYAESDVAQMEEYLNTLKGSTEGEDLPMALSSCMHIRELWSNMLKFVPQP